MDYQQWSASIPPELKNDNIWKFQVFRLSLFASDLAWSDVSIIYQDRRMAGLANQLYRAIGSISANISEGYSRRSGKDQARYYEYALGSAREARTWYYQARHLLLKSTFEHRIELLTRITRLLLTVIPRRRGGRFCETWRLYEASGYCQRVSISQHATRHTPHVTP